MDELKAYKILGLVPGASKEEIKEAYARISKEFHPEEYPEEFQQIHEAYRLLSRGSRGGKRNENVITTDENVGFAEQEDGWRPEEIEEYNFEETLYRAQEIEKQRLHEEVLRAEAEFRVLIQPAYRKKVKMFQAYFKKPEYQNAFLHQNL